MKKSLQSLVLLLAALMLPATATATDYVRGDVNGDGIVGMDDLTALINYLVYGNGINMTGADADLSGGVGMDDLTALINYLVYAKWPPVVFTVNGVSFKMLAVEGGTFTMGATAEQGSDAESNESPTHQVTLSSYNIGETEVTQALWQAVMGSNPSYFTSANGYTNDLNRPVEQVSWNDCQEFIAKLNQMTGKTFRLPTEAEWEYAARGGKKSKGYKYAGSNTVGDVAWYRDNIPSQTYGTEGYGTQPVAMKSPNELGLYDMSGNVMEWCHDWYGNYTSEAQTNPAGPSTGSYRVMRGGGWSNSAWSCRVSFRNNDLPDDRWSGNGLRLVLDPNNGSTPEEHEWVDLGLPSGTLWATCNVGAESPEDYGDYFAWGETEPKEVYNWSTYKWCNGSKNTLTKYCTRKSYGYNSFVDNKTELDPEDDAAHVNWGENWRMPTKEQQDELRENCTWTWMTQNGVNGCLVTGPNGNTLFLPAAGYRYDGSLGNDDGNYWSHTLYSSYTYSAFSLYFTSEDVNWHFDSRYYGFTVRAVRVPQN